MARDLSERVGVSGYQSILRTGSCEGRKPSLSIASLKQHTPLERLSQPSDEFHSFEN